MEQQGGDHAPGHAGDHVPDLRPAHQVHEGGGPAAVAHGHVSRVTCHRAVMLLLATRATASPP